MPELPDVVAYVEAIERHAGGQRLVALRIASPFVLRSVEPAPDRLVGSVLRGARRLGKRIVLAFDGDLFAVIHLMIAGRLRWRASGAALPGRRGLAAFDFETGTLLFTEEGSTKRASLYLVRGTPGLAGHDRGGLEVLEAGLEPFRERLSRENRTLKRALCDPSLFSGIGNAYSDEILHAARLSPLKLTSQLSDAESARLFDAARSTLTRWIERTRAELAGAFPEKVTAFRAGMAVHGRYREPCPVCGAPVQRIVYAKNEANYCAACQTGGKLLADRALSRLLKQDWPRDLEEWAELHGGGRDGVSDPSAEDWARLAELRDGFLAGRGSLWREERDLELYDAYFARRIAWKWRAVLGEAAAAGWRPPPGLVVDFGCGSGVAVRETCSAFGPPEQVALVDRSALARDFARARVEAEFPGVRVEAAGLALHLVPALLLVSHVLTELDERELETLLELALRSESVLWVEPGERESARRLSRVRERLLARFRVLAPCTHQAACGALAPGAAADWCHHFARPPAEAFTERHWGLFARRLGVDLRALPYSYLVLSRSGGAEAGAARVLGRPRVEKGRVRFDACAVDGVRCLTLVARDDPALARRLADAAGERLVLRFLTQGERVRGAQPR